MVTVSKSKVMVAPVERVWDILTDQEDEAKYWANIRDVKVLRREENLIEREATVGPRAFGQKTKQVITLDPRKTIRVTISGDGMAGERLIALKPTKEATEVDVEWKIEVKGVPGFVQGIVKNQISNATEKALDMISKEAEKR
jgi:uncharacterized protein YndB with AHSA1/START domain